MKKHILVLGLLAAVAVPASADGVYLFGDIGQSKFSGEFSETDTALAVGLGYNINSTFSLELGYHDLGGVNMDDTIYFDGDYYDYKASVDFNAVLFSAVAKLPLSDAFSVHGRLGYARVTGEASVSVLGESDSESVSENKATYGIGAGYKVNEKFALRADYIKFGDTDVSSLTVGATYAF